MMLQQNLLRIKMTLYAGIVKVKDTYDGHKCMKELKSGNINIILYEVYFQIGVLWIATRRSTQSYKILIRYTHFDANLYI